MNPKTTSFVSKHPDGILRVAAIGRISTVHQDEDSIEASHEYVRTYLDRAHNGPFHIEALGEQASGMLADRETIRRVEELIDAGEVDLIIAEDLGRIYRNPRLQYAFIQDAVDRDIRVICVADNLDTADENWEVMLSTATLRHGLAVPDARRRVQRTATYAFENGGMVMKHRFGYRKLSAEEADSGQFGPRGLRIAKFLPEATPIIRAMKDRLMRGDQYEAIADWLNGEGIDAGPYVECRQWVGRLVADFLADPILGGVRTFRKVAYQRVYKTGKHRRRKNTDPATKHYPELAHLTRKEDEELKEEVARRRRAQHCNSGADHPRHQVPRCRAIWPGQAATCGICGAMMYQYGNDKLKCRNAFKHDGTRCWNHVQVDCGLTRDRGIAWLIGSIDQEPDARPAMVEAAWAELQSRGQHQGHEGDEASTVASLEKQAANLAKAIAQGGELEALVRELHEVETVLDDARHRHAETTRQRTEFGEFACKEDVALQLDEAIRVLARSSFEFADLMRRVFPEFVIQPVQALDCGQMRPRAVLMFRPTAISSVAPGDVGDTDEVVVIDLFEMPQKITDAVGVRTLLKDDPGINPKAISQQMDISRMRAKRARDYARLMIAEGQDDPHRQLTEEPVGASRWKPRRPR